MTISAPSVIHSAAGGFTTNPYSSGSFTPVAGRHYLVEVSVEANNGQTAAITSLTFTGTGLTLTQRGTSAAVSVSRALFVYEGIATGTPTSGTITVTAGPSGQIVVIMLRVMERTGTDGINTSNVVITDGSSDTPTVAMGTFDGAGSHTVGVFVTHGAPTITASAPWTEESAELEPGFGNLSLASVYAAENGDPEATLSIERAFEMIGLELIETGGGGGNTAPDTPTCTVDDQGSTTVDLSSSAFADDDVGDTHEASQWQVDESGGDFSSPVYDSGEETVDLLAHTATGLSPSTNYIARVRHKDDSGDGATEWSAWSATDSFTTDAAAGQPPRSLHQFRMRRS